jgi:hypothetical protein
MGKSELVMPWYSRGQNTAAVYALYSPFRDLGAALSRINLPPKCDEGPPFRPNRVSVLSTDGVEIRYGLVMLSGAIFFAH